mgnify:CR=1 FL=1
MVLISAIFIIAMLVLYVVFNYRSKFGYVLSIFFFSIALLLVTSALYISKTGNYYNSIQLDYDIFLLLSRIRVLLKALPGRTILALRCTFLHRFCYASC